MLEQWTKLLERWLNQAEEYKLKNEHSKAKEEYEKAVMAAYNIFQIRHKENPNLFETKLAAESYINLCGLAGIKPAIEIKQYLKKVRKGKIKITF